MIFGISCIPEAIITGSVQTRDFIRKKRQNVAIWEGKFAKQYRWMRVEINELWVSALAQTISDTSVREPKFLRVVHGWV